MISNMMKYNDTIMIRLYNTFLFHIHIPTIYVNLSYHTYNTLYVHLSNITFIYLEMYFRSYLGKQ